MRRLSDRGRLITISWRDIPAQVTARSGREKVSVQLSSRFQSAIDRAATRAGRSAADEYLSDWTRTESPCGSDLSGEADRVAAELEQRFSPEMLETYVANGGFNPLDVNPDGFDPDDGGGRDRA